MTNNQILINMHTTILNLLVSKELDRLNYSGNISKGLIELASTKVLRPLDNEFMLKDEHVAYRVLDKAKIILW